MGNIGSKDIVIRRAKAKTVNVSKLADMIGESRQNVWRWVNEMAEPSDPVVWEKMARALGIPDQDTAISDDSLELALSVLTDTGASQDSKHRAANLVREIVKKYAIDS